MMDALVNIIFPSKGLHTRKTPPLRPTSPSPTTSVTAASSSSRQHSSVEHSAAQQQPNYRKIYTYLLVCVLLTVLAFIIIGQMYRSSSDRYIYLDVVDEERLKLIIPVIPYRKAKPSLIKRIFNPGENSYAIPKDDKKVQYEENAKNKTSRTLHAASSDYEDERQQPLSMLVNDNILYQPPIRYEPSPFPQGMAFDRYVDQTPLVMIRRGEAKMPSLPRDWDGGYGWVFVKYHASAFEKNWAKESKKVEKKKDGGGLCHLLRSKFQRELDVYLKWIQENGRKQKNHDETATTRNKHEECDFINKRKIDLMTSGEVPFQTLFKPHKASNLRASHSASSASFDASVFSSFEYVYMCTVPPCRSKPLQTGPKVGQRKWSYIEPLVGLLRHPEVCSRNDAIVAAHLMNRDYLVHDAWGLVNAGRSTISPVPRTLFFDVGAAYWDRDFTSSNTQNNQMIGENNDNDNEEEDTVKNTQAEESSVSSSSISQQAWFYNLYDSLCLHFDGMWMWESIFRDPREVFDTVPPHLRSIYRWFNFPSVSSSTTNINSWDSPLNHILVEARKEDIVILKIDFDRDDQEIAIIQQILDFPDVADLIDELYFEHHVNVEVLNQYWMTENLKKIFHSDSLKLFTALRVRGIRAHAFV